MFMKTLTTFHPTRFGNWIVKLSHVVESNSFVAVAVHLHNHATIVRFFTDEDDVIKYVNHLGEKYE